MAKEKYIRKWFTFEGKRYSARGKTEKEALTKMILKKKELEEGHIPLSSSMLVKDWVPMAIANYKNKASAKTINDFNVLINKHILSTIGNKQLSKVKPLELQLILTTQQGLSSSHISKVEQALKFIFKKAVQAQLISNNPAEHLERPQGTTGRRRPLTEDEQELFHRVAITDRRYYGYLLMLYCGCRPSEAYRTTTDDLFIKDGVVGLHIRGTKTKNADRVVPVPSAISALFTSLPKGQPIAMTTAGNRISQNYSKAVWNSYTRQLNLELGCQTYRNQLVPPLPLAPDITQYCLRHTYCTNLAKKGVDIRIAQKLMGHSDITITANIYTHVSNDDILSVASLLE